MSNDNRISSSSFANQNTRLHRNSVGRSPARERRASVSPAGKLKVDLNSFGGPNYNDRKSVQLRGHLTSQEYKMNRDVDEAQYIANRARGSVLVDAKNLGISYDHLGAKLSGQIKYADPYDRGQIVY